MFFNRFKLLVPFLLFFVVLFFMGSVCAYSDSDFVGDCDVVDDYVLDDNFSDENFMDPDVVSGSDGDLGSDFDDCGDGFSFDAGSVSGSSGVDVTASSKTGTKIVASNLTMVYHDGHKLVAYIKTSGGSAIKGLKVSFTINGVTYNRTSNATGAVVLGVNNGIPFVPGTYSCLIKFAGTSTYAASSKTVTVTINKIPTSIYAYGLNITYGGDY